MKKSLLCLGLALVLLLGVGCGETTKETNPGDNAGSTTTEKSEEANEKSEEAKSLLLLTNSKDYEIEVEKEFFKKFTEETGIEIEFLPFASNAINKKLTTMISGGEPPALMRGTEKQTTVFTDYLLPLDYDDSDFIKRIFYNKDGEKVSLPADITIVGMYVNTDLADKYGVNYPTSPDEIWTWDEFETEMEKMKGQPGVAFPAVMDGSAHRFSPMIYQHGGMLYDGGFDDLGWNKEGTLKALDRLISLEENGIFDSQTFASGTDGKQLFLSGKYGVHFCGSWAAEKYVDNATFNFAPTYLPTGEGGRATVLGGGSYHAVKGSGMEEEAVMFVEWLAENLVEFNTAMGDITAVKSADIDYGKVDFIYDVFFEELASTPEEYIEDFTKYQPVPGNFTVTKNEIINALAKLKTPEDAMNDAVKELEQSAKDYGLLE